MPNWCTNQVTIKTKDAQLLSKLKKVLKSDKDIFNQFIPQPSDIKEDGWYYWNTNNWGTKWDAKPYNVKWLTDGVEFQIETAWNPPIAFYENLEKIGYQVDAYYLEEGMCILGHFFSGKDYPVDNYSEMSAAEMENNLPPWVENVFGLISRQRDSEQERELEEQQKMEDSWEKTDWFSADIKPVHDGFYQVRQKLSKNQFSYPFKLEYKSGKWLSKIEFAQWRGITQQQYDAMRVNDLNLALKELEAEFDKEIKDSNS